MVSRGAMRDANTPGYQTGRHSRGVENGDFPLTRRETEEGSGLDNRLPVNGTLDRGGRPDADVKAVGLAIEIGERDHVLPHQSHPTPVGPNGDGTVPRVTGLGYHQLRVQGAHSGHQPVRGRGESAGLRLRRERPEAFRYLSLASRKVLTVGSEELGGHEAIVHGDGVADGVANIRGKLPVDPENPVAGIREERRYGIEIKRLRRQA